MSNPTKPDAGQFPEDPHEDPSTTALNLNQIERTVTRPGPFDPVVQDGIKKLIQNIHFEEAPFESEDIISEIMVTALKAVQSQIGRGDLKLLSRTVRELRYAFKIFKDYRSTRKITIFGSARTKPSDIDFKLAKKFCKKLADHGYMTITGAGPGIMEAGNQGAGPHNSFGINIRLPFEQEPNKYIANRPTYIDCKYFFTRKLVFIKEASGAVLFPGGFGTLDEAFELLTLVQTGKCNPIPIILLEKPGGRFWKEMSQFIKNRLLGSKKISKEDLSLFKIMHSPDAAAEEIFHFYSNYHSMRFVGNKLVIRLHRPLDNSTLTTINKDFKSILNSGHFHTGHGLKEESNQPDIMHLPRLIFNFNRINNGRLRQLIDLLNDS